MRSANFTDDRFSRDAVPKDFIGRIQDTTDYLSHLPETQVNRAYSPNISVVKNGSFMRNKASQAIQSPRTVPFFLLVSLLDGYSFPNVLVKGIVAFKH